MLSRKALFASACVAQITVTQPERWTCVLIGTYPASAIDVVHYFSLPSMACWMM
nr:MAG TPA: hypothetical protein [Caudoviricetes sp.]